jgi:hypothetical protein
VSFLGGVVRSGSESCVPGLGDMRGLRSRACRVCDQDLSRADRGDRVSRFFLRIK